MCTLIVIILPVKHFPVPFKNGQLKRKWKCHLNMCQSKVGIGSVNQSAEMEFQHFDIPRFCGLEFIH